ncbi:MAG: aminopeptidase P family protein [Bacteroidaceae bacterium]|nr:aminopeptidase P family protein [Bacteroidaceae bacterium]
MANIIVERVEALRQYLRRNGLSAFIFPSTDPHQGEYVPAHWQTRQWISGFDGSAGTAVVTLSDAALWTDSRYFIAAAQQLEGTPFTLMKEGLAETPSITTWLIESIHNSQFTIHNGSGEGMVNEQPSMVNGQWSMVNEQTVGIDGEVFTPAEIEELRSALGKAGILLRTDLDPAEELWTDRPPIPKNKVEIQPLEFAGETAESKIERVRQALREQKAEHLIISQLDDIAWLLNLRGSDVHCNPVFVSYLLITLDEVTLFIDSEKLDETVKNYLKTIGVKVRSYEEIKTLSISPLKGEDKAQKASLLRGGLVGSLKSVKNAAEIAGFRRAMVRDGVAMVKFLRWLKPAVEAGGQTELSIDRKLTALRAEQALYRGLSFDTIAAYGPHGAIVHYEATPETDAVLEPKGLLLLDSGAQYQDGTTDITRTIALGPLTDEERLDYTLVLKGHIRLALTRFPDGISGTQIDALARYAMWQHGINYGHGTGHGVGSYLCVHEGPHQIRHTWKPAPLHAGMTVTNEPGIYRQGKHGVRIENTMLIVDDGETEFGKFLRLEPLTLCPIDLTPVIWDMMTQEEVAYINQYHKKVYDELSPYLNEEERKSLPQPLQRNSLPRPLQRRGEQPQEPCK